MKVMNMTSSRGYKVPNQFILMDNGHEYFQSYKTIIVHQYINKKGFRVTELDKTMWDCSRTTGKYRNQFLGETKAETQAKINSGEYVLTNLN